MAIVIPLRGRMSWVAIGLTLGMALGALDSVVNHVPVLLGEVGTARAERGGWSQTAEFASLILDAGWAWAATAVLAGWLVSGNSYVLPGMLRGAFAGCLTLVVATSTYYGVDLLFDGGPWWSMAIKDWLISSVGFGPLLGAVGALIRHPGLLGTLAALLVPAGASLQTVLLPPPPDSRMTVPVQLTVWFVAAVATVMVIRHSRRGFAAWQAKQVK